MILSVRTYGDRRTRTGEREIGAVSGRVGMYVQIIREGWHVCSDYPRELACMFRLSGRVGMYVQISFVLLIRPHCTLLSFYMKAAKKGQLTKLLHDSLHFISVFHVVTILISKRDTANTVVWRDRFPCVRVTKYRGFYN